MAIDQARRDLATIEAEAGPLRARLAALDDRAIKIRHYIEMANLYDGTQGGGSAPLPLPVPAPVPASPIRQPREPRGVGAQAVVATKEFLRERNAPAKTKMLLEMLDQKGIVINGKNRIAGLSSLLSKSEEITSMTGGWGLPEWKEADTVQALAG